MITRLMRLSVLRGTSLEERHADETDQSIHEYERLVRDLPALVRSYGGSETLAQEIDQRLADADFPFKRERAIPRITVRAGAEGVALEARIRRGAEWTIDAKRALIQRGSGERPPSAGKRIKAEPAGE